MDHGIAGGGSMKRRHQVLNWLWLEPGEARATLDRVMTFRDEAPDPMASGVPAAAEEWVWAEQLPALVLQPDLRRQAEDHLQELQHSAALVEQELSKQAPDLLARLQALQSEVKRLEEVLS
jgi:hypothetical protein